MSIQIRKRGALTAYKDALIQAHSNRILKENVNSVLDSFDLIASEWIILCLINDNNSTKLSVLCEILQVESPHVTNLVNILVEKKLVIRVADKFDKRAKKVSLTLKSKKLLPIIEKLIIDRMQILLKGISESELDIFEKVQNLIIKNSKN